MEMKPRLLFTPVFYFLFTYLLKTSLVMKKIYNRMAKPTPPFFAKLRNIGLALTAVSIALTSAPIAIPLVVVKIAGYLAVAGTVASAVSQAVVEREE